MKTKYEGITLVIVAAFLWGIGDFISKMSVDELGPWTAALIRSIFFLPIVIVFVLLDDESAFSFDRDSIYPMLAGVFVGAGIILSRLSMSVYEVSLVKPIQRLSILITVILSIVFLGEKIDKVKTIGIGLAIGAFFFLYPLDSELLHFSPGHLYLIGLIISLGLSTVFLRLGILKKGVNHTRFFRSLIQSILIFTAVFILYASTSVSITLDPDLIYPAVNGVIGAFAFILFCKGLETVGASSAKPMMVLATITTVILGIILLNESIFLSKAVGIVMAVMAVVFLSYEESA